MTIAQVMQKMISFSEGNIHDIDHFIRVWTYAKTIGELEHLDQKTQYILEVAAITHDIACPLCRENYMSMQHSLPFEREARGKGVPVILIPISSSSGEKPPDVP